MAAQASISLRRAGSSRARPQLTSTSALESALSGAWAGSALSQKGKDSVLLLDVSDSAGSNIKAQSFQEVELASEKTVLCFTMRCSVHQLFRAVVTVLQRLNVIKQLFCLSNVVNIACRQEALKRAIVSVIESNFDYQRAAALPNPDSPHRVHSRLLLDELLWRRQVRDAPGQVFASRKNELVLEKLEVPI